MKKFSLSTILMLLLVSPAWSQERPALPATQAEVNAGTLTKKYVSPATLKGATALLNNSRKFTNTTFYGTTAVKEAMTVEGNGNDPYILNGAVGSGVGLKTYQGNQFLYTAASKGHVWVMPGGGTFRDAVGADNSFLGSLGNDFNNSIPEKLFRLNSYEVQADTVNGDDANRPVSIYGRWLGGSAATLNNLPINGNEIVQAMPLPPIQFTTWSASANMDETRLVNYVAQFTTNGVFNAFTNAQLDVWLHLDGNCPVVTNTRVGGKLAINTGKFPSGTNLFTSFHAQGLKIALTMYGWPYPTNEVDFSEFTGQPGSGTTFTPAMSLINLKSDVETMYDWRLDAIRWSDVGSSVGYYNSFSLELINAILTPRQNSILNRAWTDGLTTGRTNRAMAVEFLTSIIGTAPPQLWNRVNWILHDQGTASPLTISGTLPTEVRIMNGFRGELAYEVPLASKGHFVPGLSFTDSDGDGTTEQDRMVLSAALTLVGGLQISWQTNSTFNATFPNLGAELTNATFLKIWADPLCSPPVRLWDNGATNSSAWKRDLVGGALAVFLPSEGFTTNSQTVTWSQLNLPTNSFYNIYSVWGSTNVGIAQNNFTISVPKGCRLLYLTPGASLTYTRTNFNSGQVYANNSGNDWLVTANAILTEAAATGTAALDLRVTGTGGVTNTFAAPTSAIILAGSVTNTVSIVVPAGCALSFTNMSNGAGNSATVNSGQIKLIP